LPTGVLDAEAGEEEPELDGDDQTGERRGEGADGDGAGTERLHLVDHGAEAGRWLDSAGEGPSAEDEHPTELLEPATELVPEGQEALQLLTDDVPQGLAVRFLGAVLTVGGRHFTRSVPNPCTSLASACDCSS
jgi:hypothetical protein